MDQPLRRTALGVFVGLLSLTATAQAAVPRSSPRPFSNPYGRATVGRVTVMSAGPKNTATGIAVDVHCAGSAQARCSFLFNLVAGVDSGPAATKAATVKPGSYTFRLLLDGKAASAVARYGVLRSALNVYQQCGAKSIVLAERYVSI